MSAKSAACPAPLDVTIPADVPKNRVFGCNIDIMQQNLRTLQSLKWEINGVKIFPYSKLKILMHPTKIPVRLQAQLGAQRSLSQMAILSSFLHDKQLHKMLKTQVPMSVGATLFRDILEKMNLKPFLQRYLLQTTYLEIAFIQVNDRSGYN